MYRYENIGRSWNSMHTSSSLVNAIRGHSWSYLTHCWNNVHVRVWFICGCTCCCRCCCSLAAIGLCLNVVACVMIDCFIVFHASWYVFYFEWLYMILIFCGLSLIDRVGVLIDTRECCWFQLRALLFIVGADLLPFNLNRLYLILWFCV